MSKKYYCKNLVEKDSEDLSKPNSFGPCGEDNPDNFFEKRYSQCKKCRSMAAKESKEKSKIKTWNSISENPIFSELLDYIQEKNEDINKKILEFTKQILSENENLKIRLKESGIDDS